MHLAISFDQNYLIPFYALVGSIFYHNKNEKLVFHCIITGISENEKQKIITYLQNNQADIYFYDIDETLIQKFMGTIRGTWTLAVYYKMFFPLLVPKDLDKLLYIDTDALVINPLIDLYQQDLENYPLGAVYDCYVKTQPEIGITTEGNYFNSGVLLFNLPIWRQQQISEKAIQFLQQYPEKIKFVDQDAMNAVLINNWKKLPEKYNLIYTYLPQDASRQELERFIQDKVIIHFTLQRPWAFICKNRFRHLYKFYLKKTPKRNEKIITDFTFAKILPYLRLRLVEWYLDNAWVQAIWRKIKIKRR